MLLAAVYPVFIALSGTLVAENLLVAARAAGRVGRAAGPALGPAAGLVGRGRARSPAWPHSPIRTRSRCCCRSPSPRWPRSALSAAARARLGGAAPARRDGRGDRADGGLHGAGDRPVDDPQRLGAARVRARLDRDRRDPGRHLQRRVGRLRPGPLQVALRDQAARGPCAAQARRRAGRGAAIRPADHPGAGLHRCPPERAARRGLAQPDAYARAGGQLRLARIGGGGRPVGRYRADGSGRLLDRRAARADRCVHPAARRAPAGCGASRCCWCSP